VGATAERVCFVHVGTHKTGSTALQMFLDEHAGELDRAGFYYARSGRGVDGLHFVHKGLAADMRRFEGTDGTVTAVARDIGASGAPWACISTEGLHPLHARTERLILLREALADAGYRMRLLIYLRPQSDYLESLYSLFVHVGIAITFPKFLRSALRDGFVSWKRQIFRFAYSRLLDGFLDVVPAADVIVRPYAPSGSPDWIARDFLAQIDPDLPDRLGDEAFAAAHTINTRLSVRTVVERLFLNVAADRGANAPALAPPPMPDVAFRPLGLADLAHVQLRFAGDNALLARSWGVRIPTVSRERLALALRPTNERRATRRALHAVDRIITRARFADGGGHASLPYRGRLDVP
jgi:hypothetical protein